MSNGPWITPELANGWVHVPHWPLRWRIEQTGALAFTGGAIPSDGDMSKPLFQLNRIYRHFFGQTVRTVYEGVVVTSHIDEEGWVYAESTDARTGESAERTE